MGRGWNLIAPNAARYDLGRMLLRAGPPRWSWDSPAPNWASARFISTGSMQFDSKNGYDTNKIRGGMKAKVVTTSAGYAALHIPEQNLSVGFQFDPRRMKEGCYYLMLAGREMRLRFYEKNITFIYYANLWEDIRFSMQRFNPA